MTFARKPSPGPLGPTSPASARGDQTDGRVPAAERSTVTRPNLSAEVFLRRATNERRPYGTRERPSWASSRVGLPSVRISRAQPTSLCRQPPDACIRAISRHSRDVAFDGELPTARCLTSADVGWAGRNGSMRIAPVGRPSFAPSREQLDGPKCPCAALRRTKDHTPTRERPSWGLIARGLPSVRISRPSPTSLCRQPPETVSLCSGLPTAAAKRDRIHMMNRMKRIVSLRFHLAPGGSPRAAGADRDGAATHSSSWFDVASPSLALRIGIFGVVTLTRRANEGTFQLNARERPVPFPRSTREPVYVARGVPRGTGTSRPARHKPLALSDSEPAPSRDQLDGRSVPAPRYDERRTYATRERPSWASSRVAFRPFVFRGPALLLSAASHPRAR